MDKQAYYNSLSRFQMVKEAALAKQALDWDDVKDHFKNNWQDYAGAVGGALGAGVLAKVLGASNGAAALAALGGGAAGGLGTHAVRAYNQPKEESHTGRNIALGTAGLGALGGAGLAGGLALNPMYRAELGASYSALRASNNYGRWGAGAEVVKNALKNAKNSPWKTVKSSGRGYVSALSALFHIFRRRKGAPAGAAPAGAAPAGAAPAGA